MENEEPIYTYWPEIHGFQDTGFVTHTLGDGSKITGRVVESNDSEAYAIDLTITDGDGDELCSVTLDRLAALCLADVLIKNIMNQQEVYNAERAKFNAACNAMGGRKGHRQSNDAINKSGGGGGRTLPRDN